MKIKIFTFLLAFSMLITTACNPVNVGSGAQAEEVPPEAQEITFTASDGTQLSGLYYPPAEGPAPVVIMMHQINNNQSMWRVIAPWLQNRGLPVETVPAPWLDASWFPVVPENLHVGVFIFTYRGCGSTGCQSVDRGDEWQLDALAALEAAASLPNADPNQLITIGTSIGSDAAVDGCQAYRELHNGGCIAAMALSPDSYLGLDYNQIATQITTGDNPGTVWCVSSEEDWPNSDNCRSIEDSTHYRSIIYGDDAHGMELITPDHQPTPLNLLLDLLTLVTAQ